MAIVLAIRDTDTIIFRMIENKKTVRVLDYTICDITAEAYKNMETEQITQLQKALSYFNDYQQEKFYCLLVAGSGTYFEFFQANLLDLGIEHKKDLYKLTTEQAESIKEACKKFLEDAEITGMNKNDLSICIGSMTEMLDITTVSIAYCDSKLINGITSIADTLKIDLFGIEPVAFTIDRIIDNQDPYILKMPSGFLAKYNDNLFPVAKYSTKASEEEMISFIEGYILEEFNAKPQFEVITEYNQIDTIKPISIECSMPEDYAIFLLGSVGIACNGFKHQEENQETSKFSFLSKLEKHIKARDSETELHLPENLKSFLPAERKNVAVYNRYKPVFLFGLQSLTISLAAYVAISSGLLFYQDTATPQELNPMYKEAAATAKKLDQEIKIRKDLSGNFNAINVLNSCVTNIPQELAITNITIRADKSNISGTTSSKEAVNNWLQTIEIPGYKADIGFIKADDKKSTNTFQINLTKLKEKKNKEGCIKSVR